MQHGQAEIFHAGRALNEAIAQILRNSGIFALLAATVIWPTILATKYLAAQVIAAETSQSASPLADIPDGLLTAIAVAVVVLVLMIHAVAAAAIAYGTNEGLLGRRAGFADYVAKTIPCALAVMGVQFAVVLLVVLAAIAGAIPGIVLMFAGARFLGYALCIVGAFIAGAMVFSAYWVAIPVAIIEGQEPSFCLARSSKLTKGSRFPVFILILLTEGAHRLIQWLSRELFGTVGISEISWQVTVFDMVSFPLFLLWASALSAVTYHHLRVLREGWQPDDVTEVFD